MGSITTLRWLPPAAAMAAVFLCGAVNGAEITLYEHANFAGSQMTLRGWTPDIARTGFNDRASSVVVRSGRWELCTDAGFRGTCVILARGEYPVLDERLNDRISSAREVDREGAELRDGPRPDAGAMPAAAGPGRVVLFREPGLRGGNVSFTGPVEDLARLNFNDAAASMLVESGSWVVCRDSRFRGDCRVFEPGRYDELAAYGLDRSISSIRPNGDAVPPRPPGGAGIELFSEPDFAGERLAVDRDAQDFERAGFNDRAASVIVHWGTWELCTDARFGGSCAIYRPGRYPRIGDMTRQVSSVRRVAQ